MFPLPYAAIWWQSQALEKCFTCKHTQDLNIFQYTLKMSIIYAINPRLFLENQTMLIWLFVPRFTYSPATFQRRPSWIKFYINRSISSRSEVHYSTEITSLLAFILRTHKNVVPCVHKQTFDALWLSWGRCFSLSVCPYPHPSPKWNVCSLSHPPALETHHLDYKLIAPVFVVSLSTSIHCFSSFLRSPFRNHLAENDGHLALNFIWGGGVK